MKKGFTLAEVLITLGIVGVIASITLPSLNNNVQKQSYTAGAKKAYNTIMNAVSMYMTDQGVDDLTETPITTQAGLQAFVRQYLKVTLECTQRNYSADGISCSPEKYFSLDHSASSNMANSQCMVNVMTADGMTICMDTAKTENITTGNGDNAITSSSSFGVNTPEDVAFAAEFDINGLKGPNVTGRDWFALYLDRNGNVVRVTSKDCDATTSAGRTACASYHKNHAYPIPINMLLYNGWKMDY